MMTIEQQQCHLAGLGYYTLRYKEEPRKDDLAIDRLKGPCMTAAVKSFQHDNDLQEDGICGPETEAAIRLAVYEGRCKHAPKLPENPSDIAGAVYAYLTQKGLSAAGAAGVMGNINAESAMSPLNLEDQYQGELGYTDQTYTAAVDDGSYSNFTGDACGYGLCQWTHWTRKTGLLSMAKERGVSIGDLTLQLDWLWHELSGMPGLMNQLKMPDITVYTATYIFMMDFENPADKSQKRIDDRVRMSQRYYEKYKES